MLAGFPILFPQIGSFFLQFWPVFQLGVANRSKKKTQGQPTAIHPSAAEKANYTEMLTRPIPAMLLPRLLVHRHFGR
jgi:hypothetical protein